MDTQYVLSMCECTFLALLICVLQGHIILQKLCIGPVVPVMCLGFLSFESRAIGAQYLWTNCALQYGTICAREFLYPRVWEHLCSRVFVLEQKVKAIRHLSQVLTKSLSVLFYLRKHQLKKKIKNKQKGKKKKGRRKERKKVNKVKTNKQKNMESWPHSSFTPSD